MNRYKLQRRRPTFETQISTNIWNSLADRAQIPLSDLFSPTALISSFPSLLVSIRFNNYSSLELSHFCISFLIF